VVKEFWRKAASSSCLPSRRAWIRPTWLPSHTCFLAPASTSRQTASRSFLRTLLQRLPLLFSRAGQITPKIDPFPEDLHCIPSNTWFPGSSRVNIPNSISIGSSVPAGLTNVTNRQTDRPATLLESVAIGRYRYMRCGLKINWKLINSYRKMTLSEL